MSNITNMLQAARDSRPGEFEKAFRAEMASRLSVAISDRRADVVSGMFGISQGNSNE